MGRPIALPKAFSANRFFLRAALWERDSFLLAVVSQKLSEALMGQVLIRELDEAVIEQPQAACSTSSSLARGEIAGDLGECVAAG